MGLGGGLWRCLPCHGGDLSPVAFLFLPGLLSRFQFTWGKWNQTFWQNCALSVNGLWCWCERTCQQRPLVCRWYRPHATGPPSTTSTKLLWTAWLTARRRAHRTISLRRTRWVEIECLSERYWVTRWLRGDRVAQLVEGLDSTLFDPRFEPRQEHTQKMPLFFPSHKCCADSVCICTHKTD